MRSLFAQSARSSFGCRPEKKGGRTGTPLRIRSQSENSQDAYTVRIAAFSDGVFAVAITLLIFDIKLPELGTNRPLSELLRAQWPAYAGYILSFLNVGIFWANHHFVFHYIKRSNHILAMLNVLFLMCIAFLPFPTALVIIYLQRPTDRTTAVLVYVGTFLVSALMFLALWLYAIVGHRLVDDDLEARFTQRTTRKFSAGISVYALAFVAAFWSITLSLGIVTGLTLVFLLPTRHTPRSPVASGP